MRCSRFAALAWVLTTAMVSGQDPDYVFSLGETAAFPGELAAVSVFFDNTGGEVQGWSMGVAHDPSDLSLVEVVDGLTTMALNPDFNQVEVHPDGYTAAVVISATSTQTLSPGLDHELYRGRYLVDLAPGATTELDFTNALGAPAVSTLVVVGGVVAVPVQIGGSVAALDADANTSLVIRLESAAGSTDSAGALVDALGANGLSTLLVDGFPTLVPQLPGAIWVMAGTFPNGGVLTEQAGQFLADAVLSGIPVYVEGGDLWGFDLPSPFAAYDGVDGAAAGNGDDTFIGMVGSDYAGARLAGLSAVYQQESIGDDSTDRLVASVFDAAGPNAGAIWSDDGAGGSPLPYDTGIFYDTPPGMGKVLVQSWEFGGYGGDAVALAARYARALGLITSLDFLRGDANGDGAIDIADPLFIEAELFSGGNASPCADATDANDDGLLNIADEIFLLSYLFIGGAAPPSPGPLSCGPDATRSDSLACGNYDCP